MKYLKKTLKILSVIVVLTMLLLLGFGYYLKSHKGEILQDFQNWYGENYSGALIIEDVSVNAFSNFPSITLIVKNVSLSDTISQLSKTKTISIDEIHLKVSLREFMQKQLQFKSLEIKKGSLKLLTDEYGNNNHQVFIPKQKDTANDSSISQWISENGVNFSLEDFDVSIIDQFKSKRIVGKINDLNSKLIIDSLQLSANIKIDVFINEIGLNSKKESLLKDVSLIGELTPVFNKDTKQIEISFFDLKVKNGSLKLLTDEVGSNNYQTFQTKKKDSSKKSSITHWISENKNKFQIEDLEFSIINQQKNNRITGKINDINVELLSEYNQLITEVSLDILLNEMGLNEDNGAFLNGMEMYGALKSSFNKENNRIEIPFFDLKIKNGSLKLVTDKLGNNNYQVFQSAKKDTSKSSSVIHWVSKNKDKLNVENFDFSIINHQKNKRITGKINEINSALSIENDELNANVEIDIFMNEMGLNLKNGTFFNGATLSGELIPVYNKETNNIDIPFFDLKIDKQLFKVKALVNTNGAGSFKFDLENQRTDVKSTIALLSQNIQKKLEKYHISKPFFTYTTLEGSFGFGSNPIIKVKAHTNKNSANVGDLKVQDLSFDGEFLNRIYEDARAEKEDKKDLTLHFSKLNATYKNIPFKFTNSSLLSTPKVPTYVNLNVEANADAVSLNDFFNNKDFLFTKGKFVLKSDFKGEVSTLEDLLMSTNTVLLLGPTEFLYKPLSLDFPIDSLSIEVTKKNAFLKALSFPIGEEGNSLEFSGDIMNVTSLVFDDNEVVKSDLDLRSKKVRWRDFIALFDKVNQDNVKQENADDIKNKRLVNEVLKVVYRKFNPSINIVIDKCHYYDFEAENITTEVYFEGENELYLKNTGFNYQNGNLNMEAYLNISKENTTDFNIKFDTDKLDFGLFLQEFNYFELKSLQEIEKLGGNITMDVNLDGELDNSEGLITKSLNGKAYFSLLDVQVKGFEPLEKIGNKIFRKERFEDIRFAPISNTIYISNRTIEIPQMQIQSTAFDFFVEGHLSYDHNTNIWVSVPLSNLKRRDIAVIPELKSYDNTGKKVYVQVKEDESNELTYKLHLNNKKLYEEKGMLDQYQDEHKDERKMRKEYKKNRRQEKRELKKN